MDDKPQKPIDYFRLKAAESTSRASVGNMTRAIDSLARFVGGTEFSFASFDAAFLGEWVSRQFYDGYYARTIAYNLSKIAALYRKAVADSLAAPATAFTDMLALVNQAGTRYDGIDHADTFRRIRQICLAGLPATPAARLARDILLFAIFSGGITLSQAAAWRKDQYTGADPRLLDIISRYSRPKNKYLFPLHQGRTTPARLLQTVSTLVGSLLGPRALHQHGADTLPVSLWCDLAMSCGISAGETAACIPPEAAACSALTFGVTPAEVTPERVGQIRLQVTATLTDDPVHWYAMHLRQHTDFRALTARLAERHIELDELFYPMEEITRRVGRKMVFDSRPVISWLIFYRARVDQLSRLFHEIGDLAWGYRYLRDVHSPYAIIADSQVRDYQQAIGTLSPATEMLPDEAVDFRPGDCLVVLGGPFNGRHGRFISGKKDRGDITGRVIFRISLAGGNNVNWEVNWDSRLVRKITEGQYLELDSQLRERLNQAQ